MAKIIRTLEEQVLKNANDIDDLKNSGVTELNERVDTLETEMDTVEGKVSTLETKTQHITADNVRTTVDGEQFRVTGTLMLEQSIWNANTNTYASLPTKTGTLATLDDIPESPEGCVKEEVEKNNIRTLIQNKGTELVIFSQDQIDDPYGDPNKGNMSMTCDEFDLRFTNRESSVVGQIYVTEFEQQMCQYDGDYADDGTQYRSVIKNDESGAYYLKQTDSLSTDANREIAVKGDLEGYVSLDTYESKIQNIDDELGDLGEGLRGATSDISDLDTHITNDIEPKLGNYKITSIVMDEANDTILIGIVSTD